MLQLCLLAEPWPFRRRYLAEPSKLPNPKPWICWRIILPNPGMPWSSNPCFFGKSKGFSTKKNKGFSLRGTPKILGKGRKTQKKARKIGKRKKQGNRKKQGLEGQGAGSLRVCPTFSFDNLSFFDFGSGYCSEALQDAENGLPFVHTCWCTLGALLSPRP